MNASELEAALRTLWTKSQVPLDRANLIALSGLSDKALTKQMMALVKSGVCGVESSDGDLEWTVNAGSRPIEGPETLERHLRLEKMRAEVKAKVRARARAKRTGEPLEETAIEASDARSDEDDEDGSILRTGGRAAKGALSLVSNAAGKLDSKVSGGGKKNLIASAALSLMGPIGWFYAGSFREAVPAVGIFALLAWILPSPLLWPILFFALPASAFAGLVYAWQYNSTGERRPLLLSAPDAGPDSTRDSSRNKPKKKR